MRRILSTLSFFLFLSGVASCTFLQQPNSPPTVDKVNATPTPPLVQPASIGWMLEPDLIVSQEGVSFAVHLVQLSGEDTVVIYSVVGSNSAKFDDRSYITLIDDTGTEYKLKENITLSDFDQIHVGAVVFRARSSKTSELFLEIQGSEKATLMRMPLVKVHGSLDQLAGRSGTVLTFFRQGYLDQEEYRISNNGSGFRKGDLVADQMSAQGMTTEELLQHTATEVAKGAFKESGVTPTPARSEADPLIGANEKIEFDLTLRVENTQSKNIQYVYIVFTEDGEIKATRVK